jgi:hypothetical protein
MPVRARIIFAVAVVLAAAAAVAYAAPGNVPQFTSLSAKPSKFCAKSSGSCSRTGTTIRFTLTTPAKVIADWRPRNGNNIWGFRAFTRRFPAGTSSVHVNDSRLTTGRWNFRVQGVNSLGAGPPDRIDVHVIK